VEVRDVLPARPVGGHNISVQLISFDEFTDHRKTTGNIGHIFARKRGDILHIVLWEEHVVELFLATIGYRTDKQVVDSNSTPGPGMGCVELLLR